jgi:hypothetical protein
MHAVPYLFLSIFSRDALSTQLDHVANIVTIGHADSIAVELPRAVDAAVGREFLAAPVALNPRAA